MHTQRTNTPQTNYIGLMSGTSLDGVDGVIVHFSQHPHHLQSDVLAHVHLPMPTALQDKLSQLNEPGANELHLSAIAANELILSLYLPAVDQLLQKTKLTYSQIKAIGAHGQTVRHHPCHMLSQSYSVQLNAPALLAEKTGITVVADFRSRDIAAGGQGAPLVPAFHLQQYGNPNHTICILNLGGIANLSILHPNGKVLGFDCGPANTLLDCWIQRHLNQSFDIDGQWALSGKPIPELLEKMLTTEPYFQKYAPKSTGRDLFNLTWLDQMCIGFDSARPQDIQSTLLELTVQSCVQAIKQYAAQTHEVIVCGGGALNQTLMARLTQSLTPITVSSSQTYGLPPLQVEAVAFAWLASQCMHQQPGNIEQATGAQGKRILGAIYQA